jgi:hypothetical protein
MDLPEIALRVVRDDAVVVRVEDKVREVLLESLDPRGEDLERRLARAHMLLEIRWVQKRTTARFSKKIAEA